MNQNLILGFLLFISFSCCKEVIPDKNIVWTNKIGGIDLIGDQGLGYPIFNNTVVFHSTPLPINGNEQSALHGLDTETGNEKWTLTNMDFSPKKTLEFSNSDCRYYQYENIVLVCDRVSDLMEERYLYAIDINSGKVLWVKALPQGYDQIGRLVEGSEKYAYVDAMNSSLSMFSLLKIDVETGNYSSVLDLTNNDLPISITNRGTTMSACEFSKIYRRNDGDEFIACSINSNDLIGTNRWFMTLYVYNLTKKQKVYSVPVACEDTLVDYFYGRVCYHNGKVIVGKGSEVLCFDAFADKDLNWQHFIGKNGNDNMMQVLGYGNVAIANSVDMLYGFNIETGKKIYSAQASGSNIASIIDGVIYQRDGSDLCMRDPNTGLLLKRVSTSRNEQAFSNSRVNGADGKIFVHSYTDAFCIRAWGK